MMVTCSLLSLRRDAEGPSLSDMAGDSYKRKALRSWALSHLVMLLLPLAFFVVFIVMSYRTVSRELGYYNSLAAEHVSSQLDNLLLQINSSAETLLINSGLSSLYSVRSAEDVHPYTLYEASLEVESVLMTRPEYSSLFLYSPELGIYLGARSYGPLSGLGDEARLEYGEEDLQRIFGEKGIRTMLYDASYTLVNGTRVERLLITRPLSFIHSQGNSFCLAAFVSKDRLLGRDPAFGESRNILIFSSVDGKLLYDFSGAYDSSGTLRLEDLREGGRWKKDIVVSKTSAVSNLTIVVLVSYSEYFRSLQLLIVFAALYLVFALLAGSLVLISRIRRDWSQLSDAIDAAGADTASSDSLYAPFVSSVNRLSLEKEGISALLQTQTALLKNTMLEKLLLSPDDSALVSKAALAECGIEFLSDIFLVYIVRTETPEALDELMEGLFSSPDMQVLPCSSRKDPVFLISVREEYASDAQKVYDDIYSISGQLLETRPDIMDAASSDITRGIQGLGQAYIDAINAIEFIKLNEIVEFLFYHDVEAMSVDIHYSYPAEESLNLLKAVTDGRGDDAIAIFRRLLSSNEQSGVSPVDERYFLYSVANTVFSAYRRLSDRYGQAIAPFKPPQVLQAHDIDKARIKLEEGIRALCQNVLSVRQELGSETDDNYLLYQKALEMIASGYDSPSLNVSALADTLGVSIGHLSKSFKKYHGMNISDYISSYRVQSAKRLLLDNIPVAEAARRCGFGSVRTFMRVFKNIEGVTPGQYKALNTEEEE